MKSYQVGLTLRVADGEDQTAHRIEVPVVAASAENAAKQLADAVEAIVSAERRIGQKAGSKP
jgi:hypothetical protein